MFGDVADVSAPRERQARSRQLKNPYLKPRAAADRPKERPAPVGSSAAVERSAGRVSEQSDISLVDEAVGQDARHQPQTMKNNHRRAKNARTSPGANASPSSAGARQPAL